MKYPVGSKISFIKIEFKQLAISLTFNFYDKYRIARDKVF